MLEYSNRLDDLDIYDKEAADIRRSLKKIDLDQWCRDLKSLEPDLFEQLYHKLYNINLGR